MDAWGPHTQACAAAKASLVVCQSRASTLQQCTGTGTPAADVPTKLPPRLTCHRPQRQALLHEDRQLLLISHRHLRGACMGARVRHVACRMRSMLVVLRCAAAALRARCGGGRTAAGRGVRAEGASRYYRHSGCVAVYTGSGLCEAPSDVGS